MEQLIYEHGELISMPQAEFKILQLCLKEGFFRLLGVFADKEVKIFQNYRGDLVIEYETKRTKSK